MTIDVVENDEMKSRSPWLRHTMHHLVTMAQCENPIGILLCVSVCVCAHQYEQCSYGVIRKHRKKMKTLDGEIEDTHAEQQCNDEGEEGEEMLLAPGKRNELKTSFAHSKLS